MIKVGIIGLGAIAQRLIPLFSNHPETKIVAICDTLQVRVQEISNQLESVQSFTNHLEMLENTELDLVYVTVPPKYHYTVVSDVISKGINVLCEKPLANSTEEALALFTQAKEKGIFQAMNFPLNYNVGSKSFAGLVKSGYVGNIRRVELKMRFPNWPRLWQQNEWVATKEQGGYVLEVGVHYIQQIQKIFGKMKVITKHVQYPTDPLASENGIIAFLELEDGTPVLIDGLSQIAGEEEIKFTAYGSEGTISLVNWADLEGGKFGEPIRPIESDQTLADSLINNLVKALKGEEATIIDFSEGYEAQVVLESLRG
ncbi:Gfo/Idh/MocA family protein [Gottfriedia sp. NPDC056225]|uniref:Gfo/Idh/MocA family protein n=1 Tax=Gottfriedia sp. NPDC056225 TaxID=3345751 RepID=UPI0015592AE3|nr:Gfo/Idh/MocA family oxidoreductase [Arthrobacter citreus]